MKEIALARCQDEDLWSVSCSIAYLKVRLEKLADRWGTSHLTTTSGDYTMFKLPIKALSFRNPVVRTPEAAEKSRQALLKARKARGL